MSRGDEEKTKPQLIEELAELREKMIRLVTLSELETIFKILPDIYFRIDEQGTILDFKSGRYSDLFEYPEVFLGRKVEEILPPDAAKKLMTAIRDAQKTQALTLVEYSLPMPGGIQYYEARLLPFEHHQLLSIIRNITRYRELEQESARLHYFLRLSPNPVVEADEEGTLTYFNPAAEKEFPRLSIGASDHPVLDGLAAVVHWQKESREKLTLREIKMGGRIYEQHISYIPEINRLQVYMVDITERKAVEEELRQHQEHLQALVDERTIELETINQQLQEEIAERRKTGEELKIAKEAAESANRLKSKFLANMSHDIRTPLNSILGFTNLLLKGQPDQQTGNFLEKIASSGDGLLNLLEDILDFSKIEAGQMDIFPQAFLVEELLESVKSLFDFQFKRKGITFEIKPDPRGEIPDRIYSDKWRLHQVLTNLLANALKFTENGVVTLEITFNKISDYLGFVVQDTGIGIPAEHLLEIFQPFTRLQSPGALEKGGTGIGLAICKNLVQLMGGELKAASQVNAGSRFSFEIPAESSKAQQEPLPFKINHGTLATLGKKSGNQILIADDSPVNQELIREQLKNMGFYSLLTANNGREALQLAMKHHPDLILMDIQMPAMDGNEAIRELRLRGFKNPIIAVSAFAMREFIDKSLNSGANAYITKPIDFDQFFPRIFPFLKEKKGKANRVQPDLDQPPAAGPAGVGNGKESESPTAGFHINESISKRVREVFITDAREKVNVINAALENKGKNPGGKNDDVRIITHTLKGTAGFLGLTRLETAATRLDHAFTANEPGEHLTALTKEMLDILVRVIRLNAG